MIIKDESLYGVLERLTFPGLRGVTGLVFLDRDDLYSNIVTTDMLMHKHANPGTPEIAKFWALLHRAYNRNGSNPCVFDDIPNKTVAICLVAGQMKVEKIKSMTLNHIWHSNKLKDVLGGYASFHQAYIPSGYQVTS